MSEKQHLEQEKQTYSELLSISFVPTTPDFWSSLFHYREYFCESLVEKDRRDTFNWRLEGTGRKRARRKITCIYQTGTSKPAEFGWRETYTYTPASEVRTSERNNLKNMDTGRQPTIHFIHAYCHLYLSWTSPGPHNFPVSYPISFHLALITQHFPLVQRQWISFYCLSQTQTEASSRGERCICSALVKDMVLMTARKAMTC